MKKFYYALFVTAILLALALPSLADTVRLKDGSVIIGQVQGFKDQQFSILVGGGARGRRSSITIYMEDVESIEFDAATGNPASTTSRNDSRNEDAGPPARMPERQPDRQPDRQPVRPTPTPIPDVSDNGARREPPPTAAAPVFFTVKVTVRAQDLQTGWMNSSLVVRRGQHLRITASGRVSLKDSLGTNRWSTPAGLPTAADKDKLISTEATGALIAVIGDDNDNFFLIGSKREFVAQRDGALYLGVNQGELPISGGSFDVVIEAEPSGTRP